ncbi:MAG TPA: condensation domain-containing protein, partial [Ktedonosporobacter sp.]|nr:condensation domain-containing protein [Ktedonosporobacter sp.]
VPPGVVGELYLGGAGLARGYLGRAELTAERFLPHPYSSEPGARLYRTGDLVRYQPDGTILFVGRNDEQIKVRGYRIELGEIEAVLREHEGVRDVVVMAQPAPMAGEKRLVAYVVSKEPAVLTREAMQSFLRRQLPEYMIPTTLVPLSHLPLSPHGKVDRQKLPLPAWENMVLQTDAEPTTRYEQILATIWSEVLGVRQVGIHANFFEMGGDSILTLLIIARARTAGLILTPRQVFQHQTIAELAALIESNAAIPDNHEQERGLIPLLPWQSWFFEQQFPDPQHWNQAVCLEFPSRHLHPALLQQAVALLVKRHGALRLRFTHSSQGWEQYILPEETQAASFVRLLDVSELTADEQMAAIVEFATSLQTSLNLEKGPLLRVLHVTQGPFQPEQLFLIVHHLSVDSVSWHILLEDLWSIYSQLEQGNAVPLPAETTVIKRWAERLLSYANSPELLQEMPRWLALEHQDAPPLRLDFAAEPQSNTVGSLRRIHLSLEVEETRSLLQDVPAIYHTQTHEVLLTALLLTCAPWLGQYRLLVDLAGPEREELFSDIDMTHTVGCFTDFAPLLLDLESLVPSPFSRLDLGHALKTIKEQVRAMSRHSIGYSALRYLNSDRAIRLRLAALPQAQISFQYLGEFTNKQYSADGELFKLSQATYGPLCSPRGQRSHLLEVQGLIVNGQLHMHWLFSEHFHRVQTIELLAKRYLERLRALITHCRTLGTGSYTPSDFPELGLSQAMLDKALGKLRLPKKRQNFEQG